MPTAAAIDNPGLVERVCGKTSGDGPGVDARDVSGLDGSLGPGLMDDPSTLRALGPLDFDEDRANLLRTWFDDTFLHERACVQGIPVDCLRRVKPDADDLLLVSDAHRDSAARAPCAGHAGSDGYTTDDSVEVQVSEGPGQDYESQQSEVSRAPRWKERKFVMVHGRVPNGDFNRISQALAGTHPIHFVNGRGMLFDPKSIHNDYSSNEWNSYTYDAAANRSRASDAMMLDHQNMQMSSVDPEWCVFGS